MPGRVSDQRSDLLVAVLGATGYIGGRLVPRLLADGRRVRVVARSPEKVAGRPWADRVETTVGDVLEPGSLDGVFDGVDVVVHLVHGMTDGDDFERTESEAARAVRDAAVAAGVDQIVYLGGLGSGELSAHLRSRQHVGKVFADGPVPVTELRAGVIIGSGSASFEMLRGLVERLPAMVTPRWAFDTKVQPSAIVDVISDLAGVIGNDAAYDEVLDVGGPDVMTYRQLMGRFARVAGLRDRLVIKVPVLTPRLSSHWVNLITPIPRSLARALIDSLTVDVTVREQHAIDRLLPRRRLGVDEALCDALEEVRDQEPESWWTDAGLAGNPAQPWSYDPDWAGPTLYEDKRTATTTAPPAAVYDVLSRLGGRTGWLSPRWLWSIRGLADKLAGGVGSRRGRRHAARLRVGDAVDFWRVETADPPHALRLRAEMKMPGRAWLEWTVAEANEDSGDPGDTIVAQRAIYHPAGIWGRLYWWAVWPFHFLVFPRIMRRLLAQAERATPHSVRCSNSR
ncbi:MAG: SDR family oxidoreductase [Actinomycetota bacterium]|nr:SDR family oxidoreductase [Actinomycetota bacterium]